METLREAALAAIEGALGLEEAERARCRRGDDLADFLQSLYASLLTPAALDYLGSLEADEIETALAAYRADLQARGIGRTTTRRRLKLVRCVARQMHGTIRGQSS
jgi:alcohol dehydrogenase class IV